MHSRIWIFKILFCILSFLSSWSEGRPAKKQKGLQWPGTYDFDYETSDSVEKHQPQRLPLSHPLSDLGRLGSEPLQQSQPQLQPKKMIISMTKDNIVAWAKELKLDMDKQISELSLKQTNITSVHGVTLVKYITEFIKNAYNYLVHIYQNILNNSNNLEIEKLLSMYDQVPSPFDGKSSLLSVSKKHESSELTAAGLKRTARDQSDSTSNCSNPPSNSFGAENNAQSIAWSYYDDGFS